jgi:DNA-binding NarL/FixJ family response regulator
MLSPRQQQVCDLVCQGRSNKAIARLLTISPRTVEDHRVEIYVKMGVNSSTALVHKVLSARIAELEATCGAN